MHNKVVERVCESVRGREENMEGGRERGECRREG
jgi:hypothetical protein